MVYVQYFSLCLNQNLSTKQTIEVLKSLDKQPIMQLIASTMEKALQKGVNFQESLTSAYLDPTLMKFFKIAMYATDVNEMLTSYMQTTKEFLYLKINRITKTMQLVCYGMIGAMIILIYQVLMMPMQVINQI